MVLEQVEVKYEQVEVQQGEVEENMAIGDTIVKTEPTSKSDNNCNYNKVKSGIEQIVKIKTQRQN